MSATTSIEWTEKTWNPVRGCSVISPGCVNCYAMRQAHRQSAPGRAYHGLTKSTSAGPQWTGAIRTLDDALLEPLSWRKPVKVFVNSMSDLFHEDVPDAFIDKVFAVMALAARHTFQILTKRPERMLAYFSVDRYELMERVETELWDMHNVDTTNALGPWPLSNVWLGCSVENQPFADERIPLLLQTPAAVRFISAEPLLGTIELVPYIRTDVPSGPLSGLEFCPRCSSGPRQEADTVECPDCGYRWSGPRLLDIAPGQQTRTALDWVIVGGESGPGARPFDVAWARSIVAQCKAAGVAVFVKQLGASPFNSADSNMEWVFCNRKGGDSAEWPIDLRVREFPNVSR